MALGKKMVADAPSAHPSGSTGRSFTLSSRSLNQIAPLASMGPDPRREAGLERDELCDHVLTVGAVVEDLRHTLTAA